MSATEAFRLDYPLNQDSFVIDGGFYNGEFTLGVWSRFKCHVDAYEPVLDYYNSGIMRISGLGRVTLTHAGLANSSRTQTLYVRSDSSGVFRTSDRTEPGHFVDVNGPIHRACSDGDTVQLLKLNVEGMEFEILEHMLATGTHLLCDNIQVQFHDFVPDAGKRYEIIRERLLERFALTHDEPFMWESYRRL